MNVIVALAASFAGWQFRSRVSDSTALRWLTGVALIGSGLRLALLEREGYGARIERILREDRPLLSDVDGAQVARERNYLGEPLTQALESFGAARAQPGGIESS